MRARALLSSLLLAVVSLQAPSSGFQVISPQESQTVVAQADGQGLRVRVDLGADVRVPEHGILAMYLDETRVLLACPGSVQSAADCPTEGTPISGEISMGLDNIQPGMHVLTVELLDTTMTPLMIAQRTFAYMERSDVDDALPGGTFRAERTESQNGAHARAVGACMHSRA